MIDLPKGVEIPILSANKLTEIWQKTKNLDSFVFDEDVGDVKVFIKALQDSYILEVTGGVMVLRDVVPGLRGRLQLLFWDKQLSRKIDLINECIIWYFLTFGLHRLEMEIGAYAVAVDRFINKKLNWTHEGILRKKVLHDGKPNDVYVYSILREEVLNA